MRIGFVSSNYYPTIIGGGEISLKLLAEELKNRGHTVLVLSFDSPSNKKQIENINGVTVIRHKSLLKSAQLFSLILPVWVAMKSYEDSVDIFHIYNVTPLAGAVLYRGLGKSKRVIATLNCYGSICPIGSLTCKSAPCRLNDRITCLTKKRKNNYSSAVLYSILFPLLSKISRNADVFVALSDQVKQKYVLYGYDPGRIVVIPNFQENLATEPVEDYKSRISNSDTFRILYVGAFTPEKGVDLLIEAFSKIVKRHEQTRLVLVGSGKEFNNCVKLVENLSLNDKVTFKGQVNDRNELTKIYLNSHIFVHPAIWPEPFGRTIIEAISFGIPSVVSNVGAPPKIAGSAGLTFKRGNVDDLATKIDTLIENDKIRNELSDNCTKIISKFEKKEILNEIIDLYVLK